MELAYSPYPACLYVVMGSHAYGLNTEQSDLDHRGIYVPPTRDFFGLNKPGEHYSDANQDAQIWEVEHAFRMALKGNPSVLEVFWTPKHLILHSDYVGDIIQKNRDMFFAKSMSNAYHGFSTSQLLRKDRTFKNLAHAVRLKYCIIHALEHGEILVDLRGHAIRDTIRAIRRGDIPVEIVQKMIDELSERCHRAEEQSSLPERPDSKQVNRVLVHIREYMLEGSR